MKKVELLLRIVADMQHLSNQKDTLSKLLDEMDELDIEQLDLVNAAQKAPSCPPFESLLDAERRKTTH